MAGQIRTAGQFPTMQRLQQRPPPLDTNLAAASSSPVIPYGSPLGLGYTAAPALIFSGSTTQTPSPVAMIHSPIPIYGSPSGYYSDGYPSPLSTPSPVLVPTARPAFAAHAMRTHPSGGTASAFSGQAGGTAPQQPLSPVVHRHPKLQPHGQAPSASLRRTVLIRQQQNSATGFLGGLAPTPTPPPPPPSSSLSSPGFSTLGPPTSSSFALSPSPSPPVPSPNFALSSPTSRSSVSSNEANSVASCTTTTVPSKTPLPPAGETSWIDQRYEQYYTDLVFVGLEGNTAPFDRIRKWKTRDDAMLYDCVCGKRIPNDCLHKVKRHAYRHAVSSYVCGVCAKEFKAHWSLNAHKRIHKAVEG